MYAVVTVGCRKNSITFGFGPLAQIMLKTAMHLMCYVTNFVK